MAMVPSSSSRSCSLLSFAIGPPKFSALRFSHASRGHLRRVRSGSSRSRSTRSSLFCTTTPRFVTLTNAHYIVSPGCTYIENECAYKSWHTVTSRDHQRGTSANQPHTQAPPSPNLADILCFIPLPRRKGFSATVYSARISCVDGGSGRSTPQSVLASPTLIGPP